MIGKATLEDFPKTTRPIMKPHCQKHKDSFSLSVRASEEYLHAIVLVDAATGPGQESQDTDGYMARKPRMMR